MIKEETTIFTDIFNSILKHSNCDFIILQIQILVLNLIFMKSISNH